VQRYYLYKAIVKLYKLSPILSSSSPQFIPSSRDLVK
jgi:hypothetical protein